MILLIQCGVAALKGVSMDRATSADPQVAITESDNDFALLSELGAGENPATGLTLHIAGLLRHS